MATVSVSQTSAAMYGEGNANVSKETIRAFITQPGRTAEEILAAAAEHNVSKKQIVEAMAGNEAFTEENVNKYLANRGVLEPPKAVHDLNKAGSPKVYLNSLYGAGNRKVSDQLIQEFVTVKGRTASEIINAAVQYDVSVEQITSAMSTLNGATVDGVITYLSSWGLDKRSLIEQEVKTWTQEDFDKAVTALNGQGMALDGLQAEIISSYGGVDPLMVEARLAQDEAARLKGEYDAIAGQVDRGTAEYNELDAEIKAAQAQLEQALADLKAGQEEQANVDNITTKRNRQETAIINAQYKIDQANQRIQEAQQRIAGAQSKIEAIKSWGMPLLEQKEQAQNAWAAADAIAKEKSEIAGSQVERVADLVQLQTDTVNGISMDHDKLIAYLSLNPDLAGAEQARASIQSTMLSMSNTLESHRAWTDDLVAQGKVLNDEAVGLEAQAAELRTQLNLDDVLLQRTRAEERLLNAEQEYTAARDELEKARSGLDTAYQARMDANYLDTGGMRGRGRDKADREKRMGSEALAQAQQRFDAAKADLEAARADSIPVIESALKVQAQWDEFNAQVVNARAQVQDQIGLASLAANLENSVQSALATGYMQMIGVSDVKVIAAQQAASTGQIGLEEFLLIEKSVRIDLEESIAALKDIEARAANDRAAEELARQHFIALQTTAFSDELIASALAADADMLNVALSGMVLANPEAPTDAELQAYGYWDTLSGGALSAVPQEVEPLPVEGQGDAPVVDSPAAPPSLLKEIGNLTNGTNVPLLKQLVQEAKQRLDDAIVRQEYADMHMDWAEGKVNPKKQAKKIEAAMPELDAANKELQEAQQTYDQLVAQLKGAQIREAAIKPLAQEAAFKALGALQTAQYSAAQANAAGAWAGVAQARYAGSDTIMVSAQMAIARGTQALAVLQGTLTQALGAEDAQAAELLGTQAANNWQWGNDYLAQIDNNRAARAKTQAEQFKLDDLTIRAGAAQNYSEFLKAKAEQDAQLYAASKESISGLNQSFTDLSAIAQTDIEALEAANGVMSDKELNIAIEYALSRMKPDERAAKEPEARANPQAFYEAWYKQEMEGRKTMRKQLHIVDDIEQRKVNNEELKGIRASALQAAQVASASSAEAVEAGHKLWSQTLVAGLLGRRLSDLHEDIVDMTAEAATVSAQAAQTVKDLSAAASDELTAYQNLLGTWVGHANSSAAIAQQMWDKSQEAGPDSFIGQVLGYQAKQVLGTAQAKVPLTENAQAIEDGLLKIGQDADDLAVSWQAQADERLQVAEQHKAGLAQIQADLDADIRLGDQLLAAVDQRFTEVAGYDWFANASVKQHAEKDDYARQLHEQRVRADVTYKKWKKKSLIKSIIGGVIAVVAIVASMGAASALLPAAAPALLVGAVGGAAGSAIGQGINVGLGLQEKFSLKSVGLTAMSLGITSGAISALRMGLQTVSWLSRVRGAVNAVHRGLNAIRLGSVFSAEAALGGFVANPLVQGAMNLVGVQNGFSLVNFLGSGLGHGVAGGLGGRGGLIPPAPAGVGVGVVGTGLRLSDWTTFLGNFGNYNLGAQLTALRSGFASILTTEHMAQAAKEAIGDLVVDGGLALAFNQTDPYNVTNILVNSVGANFAAQQGGGGVRQGIDVPEVPEGNERILLASEDVG